MRKEHRKRGFHSSEGETERLEKENRLNSPVASQNRDRCNASDSLKHSMVQSWLDGLDSLVSSWQLCESLSFTRKVNLSLEESLWQTPPLHLEKERGCCLSLIHPSIHPALLICTKRLLSFILCGPLFPKRLTDHAMLYQRCNSPLLTGTLSNHQIRRALGEREIESRVFDRISPHSKSANHSATSIRVLPLFLWCILVIKNVKRLFE